jgi:hypothetical protein
MSTNRLPTPEEFARSLWDDLPRNDLWPDFATRSIRAHDAAVRAAALREAERVVLDVCEQACNAAAAVRCAVAVGNLADEAEATAAKKG